MSTNDDLPPLPDDNSERQDLWQLITQWSGSVRGAHAGDIADKLDAEIDRMLQTYARAAVAAEREQLAAEFDSGREDDILRPGFVARWIRGG